MEEKDLPNKIHDLADFVTNNQPYVIDIDICKSEINHNYWEVGMITKYKGKDVEILECLKYRDYKRVISPVGEEFEIQRRAICTLLIRDLVV